MKRLILVALILAIGFFLLKRKSSDAIEAVHGTSSPTAAVMTAKAAEAVKSLAVAVAVSKTLEAPKPIGASLPAIPKSENRQAVLDWSTDIGRGMLDAFKDPAQAEQMFAFLRSCAEDRSSAMVYRAVCAGNAKRLADRFPDRFSQNYGGFQRGLPERIQKFLAQAYTNF